MRTIRVATSATPKVPAKKEAEQQQLPAAATHQRYDGNVAYLDQRGEALSSSVSDTVAGAAREGKNAASIADDVPSVSALAVSESRIQADEQEDRQQDAAVAKRRAAEANLRAVEAARRDQEVSLAQLDQQPHQTRKISIHHKDEGDVDAIDDFDDDNDDGDEENGKPKRHPQQVVGTAIATTKVVDNPVESKNNSRISSTKQPPQ